MPNDPKYFIVTCFDEDGNTILFEIEDTPLDTQIKAQADAGTSIVRGLGALLFVVSGLLPECTAKWHAWKAVHALTRDAQAIQDRMTATAENSNDELPF